MITNNFGYGFNRVDDANRHAQPAAFSRMKDRTDGVDLDDVQKINANERKDSNFDHKEHLENMFSAGKSKPENLKSANDIVADHKANKHDGFHGDCPLCECEKCKNRRYQDVSNDSAVSMQGPTKMRPEEAVHKVKAHEMEHVRREQFKAAESDHKVVSQSVQIHTRFCEECGKSYVSGGTTRTTTRYVNSDYTDLFRVGAEDITKKSGLFNSTA